MNLTISKQSTKDIIADEKQSYANVLDFLDARMRDYICSNKGNLDYVKRYLVAYVVNNTYDEESKIVKPVNIDDITNAFKSINHENIERILGLPENDPQLDAYLEAKEEILKNPSPLPSLSGRLKNRVGFIGFDRINDKDVYFLKEDRVGEFEKRFKNMEPEYRSLKKVLLNLLKR